MDRTKKTFNVVCSGLCVKKDDAVDGLFYNVHPFLGTITHSANNTYLGDNICPVKQSHEYKTDSYLAECDSNFVIKIDPLDSITVPIYPHLYLQNYYNIRNINEFNSYINDNTASQFRTKQRLIDFAFLSFIASFVDEIDIWSKIIKNCVIIEDFYLSSDKVLNKSETEINVLMLQLCKKIYEKYGPKNGENFADVRKRICLSYPLNLLSKIKKYLAN